MLSGLSFGVEGSADLGSSEGTVVEHACIVSCERYSLCDALVDDVVADFCQTIDVRFSCTVVASFDGVIEQAAYAVAVVGVVLCCVDAALGCYGVGSSR